jgi:sugar/nucleoside kinase (ribokinase family)
MARVAVIGALSFDTLIGRAETHRKLGGAAVYSGLTFSLLKHDTTILSAVPSSEMDWLAEAIGSRLHYHFAESRYPTHFINDERGEVRQQRVDSLAETLRSSDFPDGDFDWIHLGPLHPLDFEQDMVAIARKRCQSLSVDLQGWCREIKDGKVEARWDERWMDSLPDFDWVKADEEEWQVFARATGLDAATAVKQYKWQGLLITKGARGGELFAASEQRSWSAIIPTNRESETGAGDVFTAGFGSAILKGDSSPDSLKFAAALAAKHVAGEWLSGSVLGFSET